MDAGMAVRREFVQDGAPLGNRAVLRQGEQILVRLTVDPLGNRLDNLVIEDLLAAGLEVENQRLSTSQIHHGESYRSTLPVRHLDIRDDRVLLFTGSVGQPASYHYVVRAVTPGIFILPPVSGECMYDPAIRSVHGKGAVCIEESL